MKKIFIFNLITILLFACTICFVACNNDSKASKSSPNGFSETEAIAKAVKNHPEFPTNSNDVVIKNLPYGGPQGSTVKVRFTTKVEALEKDTYLVTLTKDWGITVNGTYVKSFWKYKVTPHSTMLIESVDKDNLPSTIK